MNISSSSENQESLVVDSVFEDASEFAEKIENADLDLSGEVAEEEEEIVTTQNNNNVDVVSEALISSAELVGDDDLAQEFDLDALDALLDEKLEEELEDEDIFSLDLPDLDETDLDMYIQSSGYQHHHHAAAARQGIQNYGHGIHARQSATAGYLPHHQVSEHEFFCIIIFFYGKKRDKTTKRTLILPLRISCVFPIKCTGHLLF